MPSSEKPDPFADLGRVLITRDSIADRVRELGLEVARDFERDAARGDSLLVIPVLTGAMIFTADLIRHMPVMTRLGLVGVSSYPGTSVESRGAIMRTEFPQGLEGRSVLIVDDILDSGQTLELVTRLAREQRPASVKTCVMLKKNRGDGRAKMHADYVGFEIPDEFVVGYGLDFDDQYRNLPDIVALRAEAIRAGDKRTK